MEPLQQFIKTFNRLDKNNLALLDQIYHHEIHFEDPAHTLDGIDSLKQYFSVLYENIQSIHFDFNTHLQSGSQAFMTWTMHYSHPRLAKGRPITVDGCSCLFFHEKNSSHRFGHCRVDLRPLPLAPLSGPPV
ncbi:MAG: nuclear transport factor 2 family protein [Desulfobacteraceae bacterium]|nr:nuclear transport factor 2 family protein [Desulfobacteraceae bacterium]